MMDSIGKLEKEIGTEAFEKLGELMNKKYPEDCTHDSCDCKKDTSPVAFPVTPSNKIGRNVSCPCGSKKKYKHCCLNKREYTPGG
jgi:uncharacterized protein YecA (UPF0149 family)